MTNDHHLSLSQLYDKGIDYFEESERKYSEELLMESLNLMMDCQRIIYQLGLFSPNEEKDDLITSSIKFMSLNYYLGKIHLLRRTTELLSRYHNLQESQVYFKYFIDLLSSYSIFDNEQILFLYNQNSVNRDRTMKVGRLKMIKSLNEQIGINLFNKDEDLQRESSFISLKVKAFDASNELESIKMELDLLSSQINGVDDTSFVTDQKIIENRTTKLTKPFILVNNRQELAKQVFRPGHSLPTMTIDEYLYLERERGGIKTNFKPTTTNMEIDLDRDEVVDSQREKDQKWDEFKDDNPKGYGNTYNLS